MKAVNLIPTDARRVRASGASPFGPGFLVLLPLAVAVAFVTVYVLSANSISSHKAQLATVQAQVTAEQAQVSRLANYAAFAKLAQVRAATVREIASTRFDWHGSLSDLSRVVPAHTSLQSLFASVAPGATVGGGSGGGGMAASLRSDINSPALELVGCSKTQDDVARLMSRLRLINGVTRVTLGDSVKQNQQGGTSTSSNAGQSVGCGSNAPSFDLVVFFKPLPGAGASGAVLPKASAASSGQPVSSTTPSIGGGQ